MFLRKLQENQMKTFLVKIKTDVIDISINMNHIKTNKYLDLKHCDCIRMRYLLTF